MIQLCNLHILHKHCWKKYSKLLLYNFNVTDRIEAQAMPVLIIWELLKITHIVEVYLTNTNIKFMP